MGSSRKEPFMGVEDMLVQAGGIKKALKNCHVHGVNLKCLGLNRWKNNISSTPHERIFSRKAQYHVVLK